MTITLTESAAKQINNQLAKRGSGFRVEILKRPSHALGRPAPDFSLDDLNKWKVGDSLR